MSTSPDPSPDWAALRDALGHALDLDGPERAAFIARLDPTLQTALTEALAVALGDDPVLDHAEAVLAPLAEEATTDAYSLTTAMEGVRVGPYRIESLVGEGGMGRVYRAHRADGAFEQTVAVKVVRQALALAGSDVAARLRRERLLLATLDHPGIARLVDGGETPDGETPDGVPYLVTEFIDGVPVTDWAQAQQANTTERVELIIAVARAVDHAHRRLVVHRDLKPSNVLVADRDGVPRPVVLDFGIAKLLDTADGAGTDVGGDGSAAFPLTRTGMRMLTPAYAAPELYEPTATVTTAADVYGLGALLYELLTGRRPHSDADLSGPPTTEPTRPSRIVTGATPDRKMVAPITSRALRGDLDTICLKALHPDPARRYPSAAALADDLQRHLDGRPVEARPDSIAYLVGRFARRNRTVVVASLAVLAALVIGLVVSLSALQAERVARAEATEASARATEAADFLSGVLRTADPVQTDGQPITTREALDLSLDRIPEIASPKLRGQLLTTIGDIYGFMGEYDRADSLLTEAVRVLNTAAPGSEALYEAHHELGRVRWAMGDTEEAERRFRLVYDEAGAGTYVRTSAVLSIYGLYEALGRPDDALPWAQQFYAAVQEEGGGPGDVAYALGALGAALHGVGRSQEAAEMLEEALRVIEDAWGLDNQYAAQLHYSLSQAYLGAGDHEQAEAYALRMLDWRRSKVPPGSPRLYQHWAEVAEVYDAIGQSALAEAYADSFVTAAYTMFPDDGPRLALAHLTRSTIRDAAARPQAARADALAALRLAEAHGDSALVEAARAQTDRLGQSAE